MQPAPSFQNKKVPLQKKAVHLFIEIFEQQAIAAIWNNNSLERKEQVDFKVQTELGYKDSFNDLLSRYGSLSEFEQVTCSVAQTDFSLVPAPLFQVSEADKFLQFTTTANIQKSETDYSRLNYFNAVGVYHTPSWVKSALIPKFPRTVITHERIHFLRKLEQVSVGSNQLAVVIHDKHALFAYVSKGNLLWQLSSIIDDSNDLLYHLINAVERLNITDCTVQIYADSTTAKQYYSDLEAKKNKIKQLNGLKWSLANQTHLQFQLLCV